MWLDNLELWRAKRSTIHKRREGGRRRGEEEERGGGGKGRRGEGSRRRGVTHLVVTSVLVIDQKFLDGLLPHWGGGELDRVPP